MTTIDESNYEQWLVRYADGELTQAERAIVVQWLAGHPDAAEELTLYNEAPRLTADESLCHSATLGKPWWRPGAWHPLLRWAAAAAVLAAVLVPCATAWRNHTSATPQASVQPRPSAPTPPALPEPAAPAVAVPVQPVSAPRPIPRKEFPPAIEDVQAEPLAGKAEALPPAVDMAVASSASEFPSVEALPAEAAHEPSPIDTIITNTLIVFDSEGGPKISSIGDWLAGLPVVSFIRHRVKEPIAGFYAAADAYSEY